MKEAVYRNTANKYNDIPFSYISKKIGGGGGGGGMLAEILVG